VSLPSKLGKYEIRRELGRGAMGVVYEGFDPMIERTVAIKTIKAEIVGEVQAGEVMARFKREAQAAGRLNHPGIVQIYEYGVDGDVAFIAMEFIKGRELKDYFEAGERFAVRDVARIMGEILAALDHAHRHGVTHRDIKPANVIVLEGGAVKVADFGIARIETSELTQAGTVLGTPSYMSPEQFLGLPVDGRSDLFSSGVILYQFLTGERPFSGAVATIMHKVLKEEPLPPSTLNATLPPVWDGVVKKAMAKDPAERYQSAAQFAADITAVAEGRTPSVAAAADATVVSAPADATLVEKTIAQPMPAARPPAAPAAAPRRAAAEPAAAPAGVRASRLPLIIGGAAAAIVVAGAGLYFAAGRKGEPQSAASATAPPAAAVAPQAASVAAATPAPVAAPASAATAAPHEPGVLTISAIGLADPAKFNGDAAAAGSAARADARRQLVEKALALYVAPESINKNYQWVQDRFLPLAPEFIKTTLAEDAPQLGKDGLVALATRATVKVRDVQKSLNEMSQKERIAFIRNHGDPKIAVRMVASDVDSAQAMPPARSQLAENAIKERIKSFGFRTWSVEGETRTGPDARSADFEIVGEAKLKRLSVRLAASGLTVTKTALTSWTVKAIDKSSGEEIYINTKLPKHTSWASEDAALAEIGKQLGDEFSKDFFLAHFAFGAQQVELKIAGLPDGNSAKALLRELKSLRGVLDAQATGEGSFRLELPEGSAADLVAGNVLQPLNAKLGQSCFALGATRGQVVDATFRSACAAEAVRGKFESAPPAGLLQAPPARSKRFLKT
jgi:predicted Ser/Thr protein kinase